MYLDEKPQGEVTETPARTMKLSEAIRIGARLRPQGQGWAFKEGRSCVWGAAWEGSGGQYDEARSYSSIFLDLWHLHRGAALGDNSIATRNDDGWSREKIADWLEAQGY